MTFNSLVRKEMVKFHHERVTVIVIVIAIVIVKVIF